MRTVIRGGRVCMADGGLVTGDVVISGGKIERVGAGRDADAVVVDVGGAWVAPGFVDVHVHGALGRDTMEGTADAFRTILDHHTTGGTTRAALTTVCAPWAEIEGVLGAAREYRLGDERLAGIHVEGPFFSREKPGAHHLDLLREPAMDDPDVVVRNRDVVRQVTLAPELPGALEWIEALAAAGIRVSAGHTDAWDEEMRAGVEAGVRQATHTFNCMSSARRRGGLRVAGVVERALADDRVVCELIGDGLHVTPTLLELAWCAKGRDGIILITDATGGAGLPVGSRFVVGEIACVVGDGVAFTEESGVMAGSTIRMIDAVATMVREVGLSVPEAVRLATVNPAQAIGIGSEAGELAVGRSADLVVFDDDFSVVSTWVAGRCIFERDRF